MVQNPAAKPERALRVLVIDDDPAMRKALSRLIHPACDVTAVASARAALAVLATGAIFDGAIVDLQMPEIDGRRTLQLLRNVAPKLGERAFVLTSGIVDLPMREWIDAQPPGSVLIKPPRRDEILETLRARIAQFPDEPLVARSTVRPKSRK
jgi:CheY-like chemotaxis protein